MATLLGLFAGLIFRWNGMAAIIAGALGAAIGVQVFGAQWASIILDFVGGLVAFGFGSAIASTFMFFRRRRDRRVVENFKRAKPGTVYQSPLKWDNAQD